MPDNTTALADDAANPLHADLPGDAPAPEGDAAPESKAEAGPDAELAAVEAPASEAQEHGADEAVNTAAPADETPEPNGFAELGLSESIVRAVEFMGYRTPTPIQAQAIPAVFAGRDVLGCAQTGTGKTASFVLPLMDILSGSRARARMPRSLILEPTRELALQVAENFVQYGKHLKLTHALLIGGESMGDQKDALMRGVDVLIATPGRLMDMFERGGLLLTDTKILVIDEADRMLDMGFIPDVEKIVGFLPRTRQTLFFSATMAPEIRRLADAFLQNPKEITVSRPASVATTIVAGLVVVDDLDKRETLRRLIGPEVQNALIFCNRKKDVDILYKSLKRHGFSVGALHGDMSQPERFATLSKFKNNELRLLVCSDVAARGLDIGGLSHVFNFDVPIHAEDYVHRIGRTGRAGMIGHAFTIATPDDKDFVDAIVKLVGAEIPRMTVEGIAEAEFAAGGKRRRGRGAKTAEKPEPRKAERAKPEAAKPEAGEEKAAKPRRSRAKKVEEAPAEVAPAEAAPLVAPSPTGEVVFDESGITIFAAPRRAGVGRPAAPRPATPTEDAPEARRTRPDKREGRRDGKRDERRDDKRGRDKPPAPAPEPVQARAESPSPPRRREEARREEPRREEPRVEARQEPRRDDARRDEGRFDRNRPRDGRRRDEDLGPSVLGFGDDVPAFMLLRSRRATQASEQG